MNKEIKIIDLLNMIAEGKEVPKKIKINGIIYKYQGDDYLYKDKDKKYWLFSEGYSDRFMWLESFLRTKVEIIEETTKEELENRIENALDFLETQHGTYPSGEMWREALKNVLQGKNADDVYFEDTNKIEKLDIDTFYTLECKAIGRRINQIIDKINNM